jgi:tetratricopeptide (TPR) repeat protein
MTPRAISDEVSALVGAGDLTEAIFVLRAAIVSHPTSLVFRDQLLSLAIRAANYGAAMDAITGADSETAFIRRANVLVPKIKLALGDSDGAARAAIELVRSSSNDDVALQAAAEALTELSHPEAADVWLTLEERIDLRPEDACHAAAALVAVNRTEEAKALLDRQLARTPLHGGVISERLSLWLIEPDADSLDAQRVLLELANADDSLAVRILPQLAAGGRGRELLSLATLIDPALCGPDVVSSLVDQTGGENVSGDIVLAAQLWTSISLISPSNLEACQMAEAISSRACRHVEQLFRKGDRSVSVAGLVALIDVAQDVVSILTLAELALVQDLETIGFRLLIRAAVEFASMEARERLTGLLREVVDPLSALEEFAACLPNHVIDTQMRDAVGRLGRLVGQQYCSSENDFSHEATRAAIALYRLAEVSGGVDPTARKYLAAVLSEMKAADVKGDVVNAVAYAELAIQIDPNRSFPFKILTRLRRERGDIAGSKNATLALLKLEPEDTSHAVRYISRCRTDGTLARAARHLIDVAASRPDSTLFKLLDDCLVPEPLGR